MAIADKRRRSAPVHAPGINVRVPAVNNDRARVALDMRVESVRARRRYLQLINELGVEEGAPAHGWKSRVARRLGVHQSFVSRLVAEQRVNIGADSYEKAVAHLRLRREFFHDAREPRSYRDYLGTPPSSTANVEPNHAAWHAFVKSPIGVGLEPAVRVMLASIVFPYGQEPPSGFYEGVYYHYQNRLTADELTRSVEKNAELAERARKRRRP